LDFWDDYYNQPWSRRRRSSRSPSNRLRRRKKEPSSSRSSSPSRRRNKKSWEDRGRGDTTSEEEKEERKQRAKLQEGPAASSHDLCTSSLEKGEEKEPKADKEEEGAKKEVKEETGDSYYSSSSTEPETIAVDWHNVLEIRDQISWPAVESMTSLEKGGYDVCIISYAGPKRGREVLTKISRLGPVSKNWGRHITSERCGPNGKAQLCLDKGIKIIIDDNAQILKECLAKGLEVMPIKTTFEQHGWYDGPKFNSCKDAVDFILKRT
jgi:hypothetical protein